MKRGLKIAAAAVGAAAAATVAGAAYAYRVAFYGDRGRQAMPHQLLEGEQFEYYADQMHANIDRTIAVPYEPVTVQSYDGLTLAGKYYAGEPGAPLMIFFHGYRSTPERDASGGLHFCRDRGWHVLLAAQRAHGESGGKTITFGIRERYDCLTWIESMLERLGKETPIFLWGISMGATTVLMASGLDLPANVRGIVADCGFSTPESILKSTIRRWGWPMFPTWQFVRLGARWFGRFDVREESAVESVKRAKVPILLIHGEGDSTVPCSMVHELAEACASPVTVVTVPMAEHGISWYVDMERYHTALDTFYRENI